METGQAMTAATADITARPVALAQLLDGIAAGRVVLPDFQRDFDWSPGEVASLLATLLCGWPAGSLLLMRGRPEFFSTRPFEHAPRQAETIEYVVLDGQQRLTGLYHALRGEGPSVYVLNYSAFRLTERVSAEAVEELISVVPRHKWYEEYPLARQVDEQVLPLYALSSASDYFEWRDAASASAPQSNRVAVAERLSQLYRVLLGTVNHYDFPTVILENDLPSEAVARIFERINRTGQRLNTFDLMVARSYAPDWNLRDRWESATRELATLDRFLGDDGLPVLQVIALHDREDVRQPAVLALTAERVREAWTAGVAAMDSAAFTCETFGTDRPEWLPYKAMLLTLAGLAWGTDLASERQMLERWFWGAALSGSYDVASSTKVVTDYRALRETIKGAAPPSPPTVGWEELATASRRTNPAMWRTFMSLLSKRGARDILTGELLTQQRVPVPILSGSRRSPSGYHLRVFGLIQASRSSARAFQRSPALRILMEAKAQLSDFDGILASQFLPGIEELALLLGDPEDFIDRRLEAVLGFLQRQFGVVVNMERSEARPI